MELVRPAFQADLRCQVESEFITQTSTWSTGRTCRTSYSIRQAYSSADFCRRALTRSSACDAEIRSDGMNLISPWMTGSKGFKSSSGTLSSKFCSNFDRWLSSTRTSAWSNSAICKRWLLLWSMYTRGLREPFFRGRHTFYRHKFRSHLDLMPLRLPHDWQCFLKADHLCNQSIHIAPTISFRSQHGCS